MPKASRQPAHDNLDLGIFKWRPTISWLNICNSKVATVTLLPTSWLAPEEKTHTKHVSRGNLGSFILRYPDLIWFFSVATSNLPIFSQKKSSDFLDLSQASLNALDRFAGLRKCTSSNCRKATLAAPHLRRGTSQNCIKICQAYGGNPIPTTTWDGAKNLVNNGIN